MEITAGDIEVIMTVPDKIRLRGEFEDRRVKLNELYLSPRKSLDLIRHSPDGFSWGYSGSGCAQLALGILIEFLPPPTAYKLYQRYKEQFIATLPQGDFDSFYDFKDLLLRLAGSHGRR